MKSNWTNNQVANNINIGHTEQLLLLLLLLQLQNYFNADFADFTLFLLEEYFHQILQHSVFQNSQNHIVHIPFEAFLKNMFSVILGPLPFMLMNCLYQNTTTFVFPKANMQMNLSKILSSQNNFWISI